VAKTYPDLPLWGLVSKLERESCMEWRQSKASGVSFEEALATRITAVETTVSRKPGGAISVTVSILAKKETDSEVHPFVLQRVGNKLYQKVA
jgi:hypothetical protein